TLTTYPALNQTGVSTISITFTDAKGLSDSTSFVLTATEVQDPPEIAQTISVASGSGHHLALKADGYVWAWGKNTSGQLGDGSNSDRLVPVRVRNISQIKSVHTGKDFSIAIHNNGTLWAWGANANGQLGINSTTDKSRPSQLGGITNVRKISPGTIHTLALKEDGTVWAWGKNSFGRLGITPGSDQLTPAQVKGEGGTGFLTNVIDIAAADTHSMAIKNDGTVWVWGSNGNGKLGIGALGDQSYPVQV
ncbi:BNR repeat domain protein, partial [Candidatus Magnetomorum sp. HK-1]